MSELSIALDLGDDGVDETIAAMLAVIDDAAKSPLVRQVAENVMGAEPDPIKLHDFITRRMQFRKDPDDVELLQHPEVLLQQMLDDDKARGDCDCLSMLAASMLRAVGISPVLIVVARSALGPFEHVFYGYRTVAGEVVPCDPQERVPPGTLHPEVRRIKVYQA